MADLQIVSIHEIVTLERQICDTSRVESKPGIIMFSLTVMRTQSLRYPFSQQRDWTEPFSHSTAETPRFRSSRSQRSERQVDSCRFSSPSCGSGVRKAWERLPDGRNRPRAGARQSRTITETLARSGAYLAPLWHRSHRVIL